MISNKNSNQEFRGFGVDPISNTGSNSQKGTQSVSQLYKTKADRRDGSFNRGYKKRYPQIGKQGRVDWLQGTIQYTTRERYNAILKGLNRLLGQECLVVPNKAFICFKHSGSWECKAKMAWNPPTNKEEGKFWVSFPATALNHLVNIFGLKRLWMLFNFLKAIGFKCTRGDAAMDDYDKSLNVAALHQALKDGNYSGFKNKKTINDFGKGWTYYLGSRSGDSFSRVYNKEEESKGLIPSIRFETQLHDDKAQKFFDDLCAIEPDEFFEMNLSALCCRVAIGRIKFIDKTSKSEEKNINRLPLLDWWSEWVDSIVPIHYSKNKVIHTVARKCAWLVRSVFKTEVMLEQTLGESTFAEWRQKEKEELAKQLSKQQENWVAAWQELYCTA